MPLSEPAGPGFRVVRSPGAQLRAHVFNPVVRAVLRSPAHRLLSGSLLLLEVTGRRSGRRYALPVAYAVDGAELVVVVGQPATKTWWRNFDGQPRALVARLHGSPGPATARLLGTDSADRERAVSAYRTRFPRTPIDPTAPVLLIAPTGPRRAITPSR